MARLVDTITYGDVVVAVSEDEYQCTRITFHRRDRRSGSWGAGIFEDQDLPFLLMAIQNAYAKHRGPVEKPSGLVGALRSEGSASPPRRESWNGRVRQITLDDTERSVPRRIP